MSAARLGLMLLATLLVLAAFGAMSADVQPSALRVLVTAVVGLLAPLFWPGSAQTAARSALRVVAWSAAVCAMAGIVLWILGEAPQPPARIFAACAMLMLILLVALAAATAVEARWRASEPAGRMVAVALVLLGALPLWLGPLAQIQGDRHEWIVDAVVGASPLTHLAVASDNDLLRNGWFYQHSNLAALPVSYPGLAAIVVSYTAVLAVLVPVALTCLRTRRGFDPAHPTESCTETKP